MTKALVSKCYVKNGVALLPLAVLCITGSCSSNRWVDSTSSTEPTESREQIVLDLHKDSPTLHLRVLKSLPDRQLPELDSHFAERAANHPWLFGHLLARYSTAAVLHQVRSTYNRDHLRWGCDSRFPFLAYFLRVSATEGETILRGALEERKDNGCFHFMLSSVSRIYPAGEIEGVAIDALDDFDPEVAADAARTLSSYGSASAETHLWRALERWTARWRERSRELYGNSVTGGGGQVAQINLGDSLRGALVTAQAWHFDEPRRQRLYSLCWTGNCKDQFAGLAKPRPAVRIRVHQLMYDQPSFEVGWYEPDTFDRFREKIAQFPSGTVFGWCTEREGGGELDKKQATIARKQAQKAVESNGFIFRNDPPKGSCSTDQM